MKLQIYLSLALLAISTQAQKSRTESGFVGYGIDAFDPFCAFACRDSISGATLNCSTIEESTMDGMGMMSGMVMTELDCFATDDSFLTTLAYCVHSHCSDISVSKLERYWEQNAVGSYVDQPDPKYTYQEALAKINGTPTAVYEEGVLNQTSAVAETVWFAAYNTDVIFIGQETQQAKYGLIILLSGFIIPIAFSVFRFLPFPSSWRAKFNAHIIDPPVFGTHHDTPIFNLFHLPKRGQALFIFYFFIINTVFSAVNYRYADPNTWYPDNKSRWVIMLVSNRLGLLSFANLPLVFLYAGRNNVLLTLTNWSHTTFLLLHRWIAFIATLQAMLHSVIYLYAYAKAGTHNETAKLPYWYWGIIATLGMTILFPSSILPLRKKFYELFLAWHVFISILVVVGCYYHIIKEFSHKWGYETWIYISMAIWGFDRVLRFLRVARNGAKRAAVEVIDEEYIRLTIPDVTATGHVYLYFPTLTWRVWENHPFSIASTHLGAHRSRSTARTAVKIAAMISGDVEKQPTRTTDAETQSISSASSAHERKSKTGTQIQTQDFSTPHASVNPGITIYVRTEKGVTSHLRTRAALPVLLETGYSSSFDAPVARSLEASPTLIALAGGVGISAVLPCLHAHPGRAKVYWGCRSQALVDDVMVNTALSGIENEVVVGTRLDLKEILEMELGGEDGKGEVCVLVSGPEGMVDEVRNVVGAIVKRGGRQNVRLEVESFNW